MNVEAQELDYTDLRIKHLELIQSVIARMSVHSATIKRYAVVVTAAAISIAKVADIPVVLVLAALIVAVFALLDARYLRLERGFRDLYDEVRLEPADRRPDFRLRPSQNGDRLLRAAWSWSVSGLYGMLILFMIVLLPFLGG